MPMWNAHIHIVLKVVVYVYVNRLNRTWTSGGRGGNRHRRALNWNMHVASGRGGGDRSWRDRRCSHHVPRRFQRSTGGRDCHGCLAACRQSFCCETRRPFRCPLKSAACLVVTETAAGVSMFWVRLKYAQSGQRFTACCNLAPQAASAQQMD